VYIRFWPTLGVGDMTGMDGSNPLNPSVPTPHQTGTQHLKPKQLEEEHLIPKCTPFPKLMLGAVFARLRDVSDILVQKANSLGRHRSWRPP